MEQNKKTEKQSTSVSELPNELLMANAVHEIRTPVQTIIGTLDLLSDTKLSTEQIEYVRQIRFGSEVLLSLVNDILDFSKIKSKKMEIENVFFDVKSLTEQVVHLICIEAFNKKLEIETNIDYTLPDYVRGDPNRIQQILINLVKNAIKFTDKGYIHIELTQKDKFLVFKVTDSGIGVKEEMRDKLFQTFFQGDPSVSRKYGGTGLGLAISKSLVEKMNGKIGFYPNCYGGSVFWFSIPLISSTGSFIPNYSLPLPATTRILIVDDMPIAIESLKTKLNSLGLHNIDTSTNPQEIFLKLKYAYQIGNPFSVVFIDMYMPEYSSWHLASDIKSDPTLKNTKLILLVPEGQMGVNAKMKTMELFSGYLYKPVQQKKLDELLISFDKTKTTTMILNQLEDPRYLEKKEMEQRLIDMTFAGGIKILVAEDHPVNRRIIVEFLKGFGATVIEAANGDEAIKCVRQEQDIQIIFMDIQMPILDGKEATMALRNKNYAGIIIACTANNSTEDLIEYQQIGMNDILHKPFKREAVKSLLDKWRNVAEPEIEQQLDVTTQANINDELWDTQDFEDTISKDWILGRQILIDYIDQTKNLIEDGKSAILENNFTQLDLIAHTLKGSSASISANKLFYIAQEINLANKAKDLKLAKERLDFFEQIFEIFTLETKKWKHFE